MVVIIQLRLAANWFDSGEVCVQRMFPLGEQDEELAEEMKENSVADDGNIGGCYSGFVRGMEGLREGRGGGAAGRARAGGRGFPVCPNITINRWCSLQFSAEGGRERNPPLPPSLVAVTAIAEV